MQASASAFVWRDRADMGGEAPVSFRIHRPVLHHGTARIRAEVVTVFPVRRRTYRPRHEASATVGAHVVQQVIDTGCTERALVGTDTRVKRIRRQRRVAVLTGGPQFQHFSSFCFLAYVRWLRRQNKRRRSLPCGRVRPVVSHSPAWQAPTALYSGPPLRVEFAEANHTQPRSGLP